jgi:hypothetical protein
MKEMPAACTLTLLLAMLAFVGLSMSAFADLGPLDAMVMPGEVIKGHAKFEKTCRYCHVPFRKSAQAELCLDCHDHADVADDIATGGGYHGRIEKKPCAGCHTEHKGRNMNIAPLDKTKFDHNLTDYPLGGAHAVPGVRCGDCHKPNLKYRDTPSKCYGCHKKDDAHEGNLGKDCVTCHTENTWTDVRFDHSQTGFPLKGKHLDAKCSACHIKDRYKRTPKICYACHKRDDDKKGHKGRFGTRCKTCHTPERWGISLFKHDRDTQFPLLGKHRLATCQACHTGQLYKEKLKTTCYSCHKRDDDRKGHKGRFGITCDTCHTASDWKRITFDHGRDTRYPLRERHRAVKCTACHTGFLYKQKLKATCISCHEKDDVHKGQEGQRCEQCHSERSWKSAFFDHGLTRFPLLGKHAKVPCEDCHKGTTFKDARTTCIACHKKDDVHKRRLGTFCEQCHNARDWRQWDFDHNKRTRYRLDGAHKGLDCLACHVTLVKKKIRLGRTCVSCHRAEDVHAGAFGPFCERCHATSSFSNIKPGIGTFR